MIHCTIVTALLIGLTMLKASDCKLDKEVINSIVNYIWYSVQNRYIIFIYSSTEITVIIIIYRKMKIKYDDDIDCMPLHCDRCSVYTYQKQGNFMSFLSYLSSIFYQKPLTVVPSTCIPIKRSKRQLYRAYSNGTNTS